MGEIGREKGRERQSNDSKPREATRKQQLKRQHFVKRDLSTPEEEKWREELGTEKESKEQQGKVKSIQSHAGRTEDFYSTENGLRY